MSSHPKTFGGGGDDRAEAKCPPNGNMKPSQFVPCSNLCKKMPFQVVPRLNVRKDGLKSHQQSKICLKVTDLLMKQKMKMKQQDDT